MADPIGRSGSTSAYEDPLFQTTLVSLDLHLAPTTAGGSLPSHETLILALAIVATFSIMACISLVGTCHSCRGFTLLCGVAA